MAFFPCAAAAQATYTLPPIIIEVSPLGGTLNIANFPHAEQILSASALSRNGMADITGALNDQTPGVHLENSEGNPYQPTVSYHGFELSPIQGTPAGLSMYVNGVRFNQPFGDLALWSLLPNDAIASLSLEDGNPVYGLNALGGAISVKMKDGFTATGGEAALSGGSFGQVAGDVQYAKQAGDAAVYVDAGAAHEAGWRDAQSSDVQNFYGDLGWRGTEGSLHFSTLFAHSALNGPGTVPVDVLAADPRAQFTGPNFIGDRFARFGPALEIRLDDATSLQAVAYYENLREQLANGNGPNDLPCGPGPDAAYLCEDGALSMTRGGAPIPNFLPSANAYGYFSYAQLNLNTTNTNGYGGSVQLTHMSDVNQFTYGVSFDGGFTAYSAAGYIGGMTASRMYETPPGIANPGYLLDEPGTVPVGVLIRNAYEGAYVSDTLNLTPRLATTASARLNLANIALHDQDAQDPSAPGGGLNGAHYYAHANFSLGATYRLTPGATLYGGYSQANAAPTPAELSCASPQDSCSLANFMSGDPNLKQITAQTLEAGLRGEVTLPGATILGFEADAFRTVTQDDIEFLQSPYNPFGTGYFGNIGNVLRQGLDAGLNVDATRWTIYANVSLISATYGSSFIEQSNSPAADANGNIAVHKGDALPGIPSRMIKFGGNYWITPKWLIGLAGTAQSSSYLYGDEANENAPLPGDVVLTLTTSYQLMRALQAFGTLENLTDTRYYDFGTFSPLGSVYVAQVPGYRNSRSYSVAAPIGVTFGLKAKF